jgi:aspartyl/asparaginyl beta-hydroxylase (cupin superfamily)
MSKLWFSIYDFSFNYQGPESSFIDQKFQWSQELAANWEKIRDELFDYIRTNQLDAYFNTSMVNTRNTWRTIALKTWSIELFRNQKKFPYTTSLINKYPQILSASFNLLEPGGRIKPHCGDTNAIYRCHLGLDIPATLPETGFRVRSEERSWKNGEWLIFTDAYVHEAWNNSPRERYIFLIDVLRDEYSGQKTKVCSTVLTSLFLQKRAEKYKLLLTAKPALVNTLAKTLRPAAALMTRMVNLLKVY